MPQEFDPAWEYWTPDAEIAELLAEAAEIGALERLIGWRHGRPAMDGLIFGRVDPLHGVQFNTRLGPEKPIAAGPVLQPLTCPGCRHVFQPDRSSRRYCSNACYVLCRNRQRGPPRAQSIRRRQTSSQAACRRCGTLFYPQWPGHVYCGRRCALLVGTEKRVLACGVFAVEEQFRAAFLAGESLVSLMERFGITRATVRRWRNRLGLPPRPSGNHSR